MNESNRLKSIEKFHDTNPKNPKKDTPKTQKAQNPKPLFSLDLKLFLGPSSTSLYIDERGWSLSRKGD